MRAKKRNAPPKKLGGGEKIYALSLCFKAARFSLIRAMVAPVAPESAVSFLINPLTSFSTSPRRSTSKPYKNNKAAIFTIFNTLPPFLSVSRFMDGWGTGKRRAGSFVVGILYHVFFTCQESSDTFFINFLKNFLSAVDPSQKLAHTGLTVKRKYVIIYVDEKRRVKKGK